MFACILDQFFLLDINTNCNFFFKLPMADTQRLYHKKCPKANFGSVRFRTVMHQALGKKGVHQAGNIMAI